MRMVLLRMATLCVAMLLGGCLSVQETDQTASELHQGQAGTNPAFTNAQELVERVRGTLSSDLRIDRSTDPRRVAELLQQRSPALQAAVERVRVLPGLPLNLPNPTEFHAQSGPLGDVLTELGLVLQGADLFHNASFGTNDRTCSTCHVPGDNFQLTPARINRVFARNPMDPLFRTVDADMPGGSTYNILRSDATVAIEFTLPPNLTVVGCGTGTPNTRIDSSGRCVVRLRRTVPSINNVDLFENRLMWDARESNLATQALHAVQTHNASTPATEPNASQTAAIRAFQRTQFSDPELARYAFARRAGLNPTPPGLPEGRTPAARRGREFFLPDHFCGSCHFGVGRDEVSVFNFAPSLGADGVIRPSLAGNEVADRNPGHRQVFTWLLVEPLDPPGSPVRGYTAPDIGRIMQPVPELGGLASAGWDSIFNLIFNPPPGGSVATQGFVTIFRTSSLLGMGDRIRAGATFFHDGSARTPEDVLRHYQSFGQDSYNRLVFSGLPVDPVFLNSLLLSPANQSDIIALLREL